MTALVHVDPSPQHPTQHPEREFPNMARKKAAAAKTKRAATIADRVDARTKATLAQIQTHGTSPVVIGPRVLNDAFISTQSPRLQIALRRWHKRLAGQTIAALAPDVLRAIVKDCGRDSTAQLLGATLDELAAQYPTKQSARAPSSRLSRRALDQKVSSAHARGRARADAAIETTGRTIDLMAALKTSLASSRFAVPTSTNGRAHNDGRAHVSTLVDDIARSVRLDSLAVGTLVKTPDSVDEGLAGVSATIARIGIGSVSVRLASTRRVIRERGVDGSTVEFDAPGRLVSWAPSAMVIPLQDAQNLERAENVT